MPVTRPGRTRRVAIFSTLAAITTMFMGAAPAQAAQDNVICSGSNNAHYTPPLTNQPQDVTISIDIDWSPCVSTSNPALTSAGASGGGPLNDRSCAQLLEQSAQTITITWNTGQTTTYTVVSNATVAAGVYTVTSVGVVVNGLFKDHTVTTNYTGPATDILLCTLGLGTVSDVSLLGTLVIAPA